MNIQENVFQLFLTDSFILATSLLAATLPKQTLRTFMKTKHGWSDTQFNEYQAVYMKSLLTSQTA